MVRDSVRLKEVFEDLAPEYQFIINEMIERKGADQSSITVGETLRLVPILDMQQGEKMAVLALMGVNNGKYVPKLDHERRCQVLALYRVGITREALAAMFGINTRTVGHIYSQESPHYRQVKEEETLLGREKFIEKYMNDDLLARAMSYRMGVEKQVEKNNRYAKGKAGVHVVRPTQCLHEHRVIISWREDNVPGWYYQDRDGDMPDSWFSTGPDSMRTSRDCFVGMLKDIADAQT